MRPREELPGRSPIALGQTRLTLEFLGDGLPEKKLQLVGTSILLILLSPGLGCYTCCRQFYIARETEGESKREREREREEKAGLASPCPECAARPAQCR